MEDVKSSHLLLATILIVCISASLSSAQGPWVTHGGGLENRREGPLGSKVSAATVNSLALRWSLNVSNEITATPTVADGMLYFPVWTDGNIYAVDALSGVIIWTTNISHSIGMPGTFARASTVVADEYLLVGVYNPAIVVALYRFNGTLAWNKTVDENPYAQVTMAGTPFNGSFFVGLSSKEEGQYLNANCCTFRGSFLKMELHTGTILWRTYMVPENNGTKGGYSGVAIWGSSPAIDVCRHSVYIATGNLYTVPPNVTACEAIQQNKTVPDNPDPCLAKDVYQETVLSLDLDTGAINWAARLGSFDVYNNDCKKSPHPYCPPLSGPDFDFGECPMMLSISVNESWTDVVTVGQKSGVIWTLNRNTGVVIWAVVAGPGATSGGAIWGSATDGERVYVNIANGNNKNFTLRPGSGVTLGGGWVGMNATTGSILWTTAVPGGWVAHGPVSVSNGLVLVGGGGPLGGVYGLDALTGRIIWQAPTKGTMWGGFAIDDSCGYIGSGVNTGSIGKNTTAGQTIYAFCAQ